MRKLLLLAATVIASFSVNAQVTLNKLNIEKDFTTKITSIEKINFNYVPNSVPVVRKSSAGYWGTWIRVEYDEKTALYECNEVLMEQNENEEYNVKVTFKNTGVWAYGKFENNSLSIPAQYLNDGNIVEKIGSAMVNSKIAFFGMKLVDEGQSLKPITDKPLVLIINNETKCLELSKDDEMDGWAMRIESGQYANQLLDLDIEPEMYKSNGTLTSVRSFGGDDEPQNINLPVFVKDGDEEILVYNHIAGSRIKIAVDKENGIIEMSTPQNIFTTTAQQKAEGVGDYFYTKGIDETTGHWHNDDIIEGTWQNNVITFKPYGEDSLEGTYTIGTDPNPEGKFYWIGMIMDTVINYSNDDPAGIENVGTDAVKKDNRIFNLAGQQVGNDYKGIVIKNGVKKIQK